MRPVAGFVRAARVLLEHGASPDTHFLEDPNKPGSVKETALYGAAGVANEPRLTKLLLDAGADVNDLADGVGSESLYHASEFDDLRCLRAILQRGPRPDNISYCLARKLDFEDLAGARLYLKHGADPNFRFGFPPRNTRLHHAVIRGRGPAIIKLLLDHGADVNARNDLGFTAYQLARLLGHTKVAELLLRSGAADDLDDRQRFLAACAAGDARTARRLLASQPKLMQSLTPHEARILPEAAAAGHLKAVRVMLDLGFDPDAPGDWGGSALHQAAWSGHVEIVRLLLARGANPETRQHYGGDALHTAIHGSTNARHKRGPRVVQLILRAMKHPELETCIRIARENEDEAVVRVLEAAQQPRRLKAPKKSEWKPLMTAAFEGDAEKVKRLLAAGADPNVISGTSHRYRPLHRAIEHKKTLPKHEGHHRVIKLLLDAGADPKLRWGNDQLTALALAAVDELQFVPILRPHFEPLDIFHSAAVGDDRRVVELLRSDPSLASRPDLNTWTPLHYCAASRMHRVSPVAAEALARIAKHLLDAGADPMAPYLFNGEWPLRPLYMAAGRANNPDVVRVLLDAGADPCDGEAVFHAADEMHLESLRVFEQRIDPKQLAEECTRALPVLLHWNRTRGAAWLLAHGADPNALHAQYGESAFHIATKRGSDLALLRLMLEHGADPRRKTKSGSSAIDLARKARKPKVVKLLEEWTGAARAKRRAGSR
jgi:ankyrin repeat protein